jgi:hypothetical protein
MNATTLTRAAGKKTHLSTLAWSCKLRPAGTRNNPRAEVTNGVRFTWMPARGRRLSPRVHVSDSYTNQLLEETCG